MCVLPVALYVMRYSSSVTSLTGSFDGTTALQARHVVSGNLSRPAEGGAGQQETITVSVPEFHLPTTTTTFFALKALDDQSQASGVSNYVAVTFTPWGKGEVGRCSSSPSGWTNSPPIYGTPIYTAIPTIHPTEPDIDFTATKDHHDGLDMSFYPIILALVTFAVFMTTLGLASWHKGKLCGEAARHKSQHDLREVKSEDKFTLHRKPANQQASLLQGSNFPFKSVMVPFHSRKIKPSRRSKAGPRVPPLEAEDTGSTGIPTYERVSSAVDDDTDQCDTVTSEDALLRAPIIGRILLEYYYTCI